MNMNDSKAFIKEMAKGEIDQNFLGSLLQGQLYLDATGFQEVNGLTELLAEHYDFSTNLMMGENILCSLVVGRKMGLNFSQQMTEPQFDFRTSMTEEEKETYEVMQRIQDKTMIDNISNLIKLGADANITCQTGDTVTEIIEELRDAGVIDEYDLQFDHTPSSEPCLPEIDTSDLVGLCDVANATGSLSNQIQQNDRVIPKLKANNGTMVYVEGKEKCHFRLLDKIVKGINGEKSREISLTIADNTTHKEITLTSKSKEDFLKKLDALMK